MMSASDVRQRVRNFHMKSGFGTTEADALAPWWLHHQFELSPGDALQAVASGPKDKHLDAFHIEVSSAGKLVLHLIKATFSATEGEIIACVRSLAVALEFLRDRFDGPSGDDENTIWTRLHARLNSRGSIDGVEIACKVIHLSERQERDLRSACSDALDRFEEAARANLPGHRVRMTMLGPSALRRGDDVETHPSAAHLIRFRGINESVDGTTSMWIGLARLADLVKLYERAGDVLFSKNVRLFNFRAAEKGPSRQVQRTLGEVVLGGSKTPMPSAHFTLFHNGISMHADGVRVADDSHLEVRNPSVLNGCQTLKSSWLFKQEHARRRRPLDERCWDDIQIPIRIVKTTDDALVRRITVSNNRQTSIRPSAFRANDPVQLELAERFRREKIYYERQESAFENLQRTNSKGIDEHFSNSEHAPLKMEEVAQAIAVAANTPAISVAAKVSEIFTEDRVYDRIFDRSRLQSPRLLVFLRNLLTHIHLVLKDARQDDEELEGMRPTSFRYPATRVMARFIVLNKPQWVEEFGVEVIHRPSPKHPLRISLRKAVGSGKGNARLLQALKQHWGGEEQWKSANDGSALMACLRALELDHVDVFSAT